MTNAQMPSINAMSTRIVYLPGMMTGQIISGIDAMPGRDNHQILVMFSIVGGTGFGIVVAALRLTDNRQRLHLDRLAAARAPRPRTLPTH